MGTTMGTIRSARSWITGRATVRERAVQILRDERSAPALLITPPEARTPRPVWILLHGVTRPGIEHPQLLRIARALAAGGAVVLVPEVPEWKELRLAPGATLPTVATSIEALRGVPEAAQPPYGLMGFSFGGPQALIAASHESVAQDIGCVVSFGGYCDLERTLRFHFTGEHEWRGRLERVESPDPYGRWVVGANYLTSSPGFEDATAVASALWELAASAGAVQIPASSPEHDPLKVHLRSALSGRDRKLFDVFAPPAGREPERAEAERVIRALVQGSRSIDPLMDPAPFLGGLHQRVELLHGRGDTLIPYTESLRLCEALPDSAHTGVTITRLFAHAKGDRFPTLQGSRELWTLFRALRRIFGSV